MKIIIVALLMALNADDPEAVKKHYLNTAIAQYLSGEKISEPKTASVGCGIKFRK
jgi:hypothetical protein